MNVIGSVEALEALNKRLQKPISRQLFSQSIQPELLRTGYATQVGGTTVIDGEAWAGWWIGYIEMREKKIAAGEWLANRPYSAEEAEGYRDGVFDDEAYQQELVVNLYEDNAGRLFIGTDVGPWWNVTGMPDNCFHGDAMAIIAGDTDNWTVEQLDAEPDADIVAWYEGQTMHVEMQSYEPKAKIAACKYMGFVLPVPGKGTQIWR